MKPENVRLVVLPTVGAAVLGGIVWMSGIPLSNASVSPDSVTLEGRDHGATLTVTGLMPGDAVSRTVTISNPAAVPSRLTMTEHGDPQSFDDGQLRLVISRDGQRIYAGRMGAMADYATDQGWIPARSETTYTFTVSLPESAPLVAPGTQSAVVDYTWETEP